MIHATRLVALLCLAVPALTAGPSLAERALEQRALATERMLAGGGDETLREYAREHLSEGYRDSFADEPALLAHLRALREAVGPVDGVGLMLAGENELRLNISNRHKESVVAIEIEPVGARAIRRVELLSQRAVDRESAVGWENLEEALEEAESSGFSGSILVIRDGETVIDRGYGHADPQGRHPVTPRTLFAIGSTPIDFTHAAILKLWQEERLSLDDPITEYFEDVPGDKQEITLEHLRTGRSGLQNFHGDPEIDANLDLSWIDRKTALDRIFDRELLFEPGTDERHSHSAWGVLAAVVEIVSGRSYDDYLRENFFEPAKMERTGPYPITRDFPESEVAVGLGGNRWGEVNSPPHWGETSWLVLGSGGMVSTPRDLWRWRRTLAGGEVLGPEAQRLYGIGAVIADEGGNDRGFLNVMAFRGDDAMILCSNSHAEMDDAVADLGRRLVRLILDQ